MFVCGQLWYGDPHIGYDTCFKEYLGISILKYTPLDTHYSLCTILTVTALALWISPCYGYYIRILSIDELLTHNQLLLMLCFFVLCACFSVSWLEAG